MDGWGETMIAAFAGVTAFEWGGGVLLLGLGVLLGLWLRRGSRTARQRIAHLETELRESRERLEAHQEAVTKHFGQTSELFGDLTRQYTALYAHLAEGARDLCDRIPELGRGFSDPLLPDVGSPAPEAGLTDDAREIASRDEPSETAGSQTARTEEPGTSA